jgi:mono/diheme cytochrome c family protein
MRHFLLLGLGAVGASCLLGSIPIPGDASRGAQIFKDQKCIVCHSVNGVGGKSAPDLGRRTGRDYTPSTMVSLMWNHAPAMWSAMAQQGISKPQLTEEQAADLFAYFAATRYFDKPGDAGRGKQLFASKHCADCHSLSAQAAAGGPAVMKWETLADPIALAQSMWNHSTQMGAAMAKKGISKPALTSQELTDIQVYLQSRPEAKGIKPEFAPASASTGEELFKAKGCAHCHSGANSLVNKFKNRSLTDFAAAMWNHGRKGNPPQPELRPEEMKLIVGYLWSIQYFEPAGDPKRGKAVFDKKACSSCHNQAGSGAPNLASKAGHFSDFAMVSSLWGHGGPMLNQMLQKKVGWPRFTPAEMSDLIAYLNNPK